jgi:hypothetical protein
MDLTDDNGKHVAAPDGAASVVEQLPTEPGEEDNWKLVSAQGKVAYESDLEGIHLWSRSRIIDDLDITDHVGLALENLQMASDDESDLNDYIERATSTLEELYSSLRDEDEDEKEDEGDEEDQEDEDVEGEAV